MAFSEPEKTDIRRFCGYPAYGSAATGFANWRFFQAYGLLEFRMNNLSSAEEMVVRRYLGTLLVLEHAVHVQVIISIPTRRRSGPATETNRVIAPSCLTTGGIGSVGSSAFRRDQRCMTAARP